METYEEFLARSQRNKVLVVDDVAATCAMHRLMLIKAFDVDTASSGAEALALCAKALPDLVLLDVDMPGMSGFDLCRKLRETSALPIIFVTGHESADEHLKCFEAGGTDICVKPVAAELLLRKVTLAIEQQRERQQLLAECASLRSAAAQHQQTLDKQGALLVFMRESLQCPAHDDLARLFVRTAQSMGLQCCVAIRHEGHESSWGNNGGLTAQERSVLTQLSSMGREIQFKSRLGINHERVSVVIHNMPDEASSDARRILEHMRLLVESTEALSEHVARQASQHAAKGSPLATAEQLRQEHRLFIDRVGLALRKLQDNVEESFDRVATDKHQEEAITAALHEPIEELMQILQTEASNDQHFATLITQLR